jgi:hypothetical protein
MLWVAEVLEMLPEQDLVHIRKKAEKQDGRTFVHRLER